MIYVGIDPGLNGAIAAICEEGALWAKRTPTVPGEKNKRNYDIARMLDLMYFGTGKTVFVALERQQAFPGQGSVSTFRTGEGFGIWQGVLAAEETDYTIVSPRKWQNQVAPAAKGESKEMSILMAGMLFPKISLLATPRSKKPHDGMADALCIAEWGRRNYKFIQATKQGGG